MSIFIAWSGDKTSASYELAKELRTWLPKIFASTDIYFSKEDNLKGEDWWERLSGELASSRFGILCITRQNVSAPWINFEAGALTKTLGAKGKVCPLLFDIAKEEVKSPLSRYELCEYTRDEVRRLLKSINESLPPDHKLSEQQIDEKLDDYWLLLDERIRTLKSRQFEANAAAVALEQAQRNKRRIQILVCTVLVLLSLFLGRKLLVEDGILFRKHIILPAIKPIINTTETAEGYIVKVDAHGIGKSINYFDGLLELNLTDTLEYKEGKRTTKSGIEDIKQIDYKGENAVEGDSSDYYYYTIKKKNRVSIIGMNGSQRPTLYSIHESSDSLMRIDQRIMRASDISLTGSARINGIECVDNRLFLLGFTGWLLTYNLDHESGLPVGRPMVNLLPGGENFGWQGIDLLERGFGWYKFLASNVGSKKTYTFKVSLSEKGLEIATPQVNALLPQLERELNWYEGAACYRNNHFLIGEAASGLLYQFEMNRPGLKQEITKSVYVYGDPALKDVSTYVEGVDVDTSSNRIFVSDRLGNIYWMSFEKFDHLVTSNSYEDNIWNSERIRDIDHCHEIVLTEGGELWVAAENEILLLSKMFFYQRYLHWAGAILILCSIVFLLLLQRIAMKLPQTKL